MYDDWVAVSNAPEKRILSFDRRTLFDEEKGDKEVEEVVESLNLEWMIDQLESYQPMKIYEFEDTLLMSTYLITINAGTFKVYEHKSILPDSPPQRVFYRPS